MGGSGSKTLTDVFNDCKKNGGTIEKKKLEALFDEYDKNKDGAIDAKEMCKLLKEMMGLVLKDLDAAAKDLKEKIKQAPPEFRDMIGTDKFDKHFIFTGR